MMNHIMLDDGISVFYYVALFAIYSFMGWIIEVIYRSITQRKFVNAGFLYGPFIPIYGIGAAFIIILQYFFPYLAYCAPVYYFRSDAYRH